MARILTADQFKACPRGTVFGYGGRWHFGALLILDEIISGPGWWGFYACSPLWVDPADTEDTFAVMDDMLERGTIRPASRAATKYTSYDGDEMSCFFVLDEADLRALVAMTTLGRDDRSVTG